MPRNITAVEAAIEKLFQDTEPRTSSPPKSRRSRAKAPPSSAQVVVQSKTTKVTRKDKADKSTRALVSGKINKAERKAGKAKGSAKPKRNRNGVAMMFLNTKHHKRKVYVSPEQRRTNKIQDGARMVSNKTVAKSMLSVVGTALFKYKVPDKNPTPVPRTVRMKTDGALKKLLRTQFKHPPMWRQTKVALLKAA